MKCTTSKPKNPFKRMETWIHGMVKVMAAVYLLYRTARFVFGKRIQNFWLFLIPQTNRKVNEKADVSPEKPAAEPCSIVGKSQTTYLKETPQETAETIQPAFSEDLEQEPAYEEEPDITAEDVEDRLHAEELSEEDRFMPLDTAEDDGGVSTGMTYEQIGDTLDVVSGKKTGAAGVQAAAQILYEIQGSDVFNFLVSQAETEQVIEQLLSQNLDAGEKTLPENAGKRRDLEAFDMDRYV